MCPWGQQMNSGSLTQRNRKKQVSFRHTDSDQSKEQVLRQNVSLHFQKSAVVGYVYALEASRNC